MFDEHGKEGSVCCEQNSAHKDLPFSKASATESDESSSDVDNSSMPCASRAVANGCLYSLSLVLDGEEHLDESEQKLAFSAHQNNLFTGHACNC